MESVWDYPRPPVVKPCHRRARVVLGGFALADSESALRVLETSQAPAIYFPPGDVAMEYLRRAGARSLCEWKGMATYFDAEAGERSSEAVGWTYENPDPRYPELRDHAAFYPQRVDECWLGDERVEPNQGDFYGGWITSDIAGPFKGGPGSRGW